MRLGGMALDIKICGLKTPETLGAALAGGASHVGFNFFLKSPRYVSPGDAANLRLTARGKALAVAVVVDAVDDVLDEIVAAMQPDMLQLHGKESPERVASVKSRYGLPVMKALSISETADLARIDAYRGIPDKFLFDAKPPAGSVLPGGNGVTFDWSLLHALGTDVDYMLSGGLNAGNIGDALRLANPRGIDTASGVESAPGVKDIALIDGFFAAVAAARTRNAA